ncbi:glycosyltransferase [Streptococcus suis]|uniref:Glycosyl transferase n=1 Tax=Streptococcus suis TaxID=1307 RepID=A0A0Z8D795_STRSU|nr:glycosyltransferase [Streptococcus suis]NQH68902.1 glycosyltransferase [Streptococcus suis]NQI06981.1 glycosyltransferase [Streptococcus suis]NQO66655.1 glycosyltransferase [Streptococcus suis]NQP28951.1 glycosyltransferase [Streptococcus suis]NQP43045.1 glycosyltransferase [Streptococcus suis]
MSKSIIIVTHHLGGLGGVQRVVDQLAKRFVRDGNDVTVIGCGVQKGVKHNPKNLEYEEILLYSEDIFFDKPWMFFVEKIFSKKLNNILEDKLSKNNDAVVILANPIVYLLMDNIIRKWRDSATFIGQMHSSADFVLDSRGLYLVYPFIIKHFYPKLDKILFLTPEDSKIIQDAYAIDAAKMGAIGNPLPNYIHKDMQLVNIDNRVISFVGRLDPVKQVDHVIRAFAKIAREFPGIQLQIYGDGNERESLESLIAMSGAESQIHLMGSTDRVEEVYKNSLFTVMTSKTEGWGLSIVESMLMGVPVLSYACSPSVSMLQSATPEMLVCNGEEELAEKMRYYLTNSSELVDIARRGQTYLTTNFSEDKIVEDWYILFDSIKK